MSGCRRGTPPPLRSLMRIAFLSARRLRTAIPQTRNLLIASAGLVSLALLVSLPAFAEHTRWWTQNSFEDFDKGTAKGVALRSDGKVFLAPHFAEFADSDLAYLLATC